MPFQMGNQHDIDQARRAEAERREEKEKREQTAKKDK